MSDQVLEDSLDVAGRTGRKASSRGNITRGSKAAVSIVWATSCSSPDSMSRSRYVRRSRPRAMTSDEVFAVDAAAGQQPLPEKHQCGRPALGESPQGTCFRRLQSDGPVASRPSGYLARGEPQLPALQTARSCLRGSRCRAAAAAAAATRGSRSNQAGAPG